MPRAALSLLLILLRPDFLNLITNQTNFCDHE
jgi:hypothetical protein